MSRTRFTCLAHPLLWRDLTPQPPLYCNFIGEPRFSTSHATLFESPTNGPLELPGPLLSRVHRSAGASFPFVTQRKRIEIIQDVSNMTANRIFGSRKFLNKYSDTAIHLATLIYFLHLHFTLSVTALRGSPFNHSNGQEEWKGCSFHNVYYLRNIDCLWSFHEFVENYIRKC